MKKIYKYIMKFINNLSLKYKFISATVGAVILVGLSALFAMKGVMVNNEELLYRSIATSLSYSAEHIHSILESVEVTSSMIIADSSIQNNLAIMNNEAEALEHNIARRNLYNTLHTYYFSSNTKYLDYMSLYYKDTPLPISGRHHLLPADDGYEDIKAFALKHEGASKWISSYGNEKGLLLVRSIRQIKRMTLDNLGFLTIKVNLDEIIPDATDFGNQFSNSSFILLDENEVLYRSKSISESQAKTLINFNSSYDVITLDNLQYFAVKDSIPNYELDYICLVSYTETQKHISKTYYLYFTIVIASIVLALSLASTFVRNITKHLEILTKKMHAFQNVNMEILPRTYNYSKRYDELGILHTNFDSMAHRIKTLVEKNYVTEILRKDAQLKALEAQIDPHFLYNTLDSINWRAKAIGENQISLMVESLGSLLRSTLNESSHHFTLKDELTLVEHYMAIQQIRYEDRLIFELETENPKLLDATLPKLCIQPLVENSIQYALEKMTDQCYIYITITKHNDILEIRVKNNGSQFEDDILNRLQSRDLHPHGFGIALRNINHRIKLQFGEEYGLTFYNEDDFAIAMISVPYTEIK